MGEEKSCCHNENDTKLSDHVEKKDLSNNKQNNPINSHLHDNHNIDKNKDSQVHDCCAVKDVNTRFAWFNKIIKWINDWTNLWIIIFINIVLLSLLNFLLQNNSFLDYFFNDKSIIMLVIATFAMLLLYPKFLIGFFNEAKLKSFGMNTTVAFSATVAYFLSLGLFISNYLNNTEFMLYFDAGIAILVFLSIGMSIERKITQQGKYDIYQMLKLKDPKIVSQNGEIIPLKRIKIGDLVYINPHSDILVDGKIIEGETFVTEAFLTGEENPIHKKIGMLIQAGSTNIGKRILVKVVNTLEQSNVARIINQSKNIAKNKPPIQKFADKFARWLIIFEIIGAILSFLYKFFVNDDSPLDATIWSLTVFIILCPCALGILTPAILMTSSSIMNKRNILVKNSATFNLAKRVKYAIFDKTGTVVSNKLSIEEWKGDDNLLAIIKGMEIISEHPIAKAIFAFKTKITPIKNIQVKEIIGIGLEASYKDNLYHLGGRKLLEYLHLNLDSKKGEVLLLKNNQLVASFIYKSKINPNLVNLIKKLNKEKIKTILLSGDNIENVKHTANEIGFDEYFANKSPEEKEEIVSRYKKQGIVLYTGDGINDTIALSKADISVSISSEYNSFNIPSDIIIFNEKVANVYPMLDIMKKTQVYVKFGLIWAFLYNVVVFFVTIFLDIDPILGAFLMLTSTIFILLIVLVFRLMNLGKKDYYKT